MHTRLISFITSDKLELPGLLYESDKKTEKVMLYLHGNGSSSVFYEVILMNVLAFELNKKNISFFPFNNRGAHYIKSFHVKKNGVDERIKLGTTYEFIKDCVLDVDAAIDFLEKLGYKEFYIMGISTGANKIVVYNHYKPKNKISKYILLSGGDDTGLFYEEMGRKKFQMALEKCQEEIKKGNGRKIIPKYFTDYLISYQSFYDTINPNGDYNCFPFNEYMNDLRLSKKSLFHMYKKIKKPTLVAYGEFDKYCYGDVPKCVEILKRRCPDEKLFNYKIIKDADHGFNGKEKELAEIITNWL